DEGEFASPRASACVCARVHGRDGMRLRVRGAPAAAGTGSFDVDDGRDWAVKPASAVPPPPPPPLLRPSRALPSLFSHHPGLCTGGLGSESSGDVDLEDIVNDMDDKDASDAVQAGQGLTCKRQHRDDDEERARTRGGRASFPPPISV